MIPYDLDVVPIVVLSRVEIAIYLVESSNAINKFLCAEVVRAGRVSRIVSFWARIGGINSHYSIFKMQVHTSVPLH